MWQRLETQAKNHFLGNIWQHQLHLLVSILEWGLQGFCCVDLQRPTASRILSQMTITTRGLALLVQTGAVFTFPLKEPRKSKEEAHIGHEGCIMRN